MHGSRACTKGSCLLAGTGPRSHTRLFRQHPAPKQPPISPCRCSCFVFLWEKRFLQGKPTRSFRATWSGFWVRGLLPCEAQEKECKCSSQKGAFWGSNLLLPGFSPRSWDPQRKEPERVTAPGVSRGI